jgi:lysophospholipase L1-like esterase
MSWIKNILTILFSILIALVIAEIILRFVGAGYGNSPLERSHTYHHVHPNNYQFLMHDPNGEYGGYHVYYDNLGFRVRGEGSQTNELANEDKAIIFLGDSFTEGNQVRYNETFASLVSERLGLPSVNFGVSSYSPLIYELQVKNVVSQFNADVVVMQIYSNDFAGDESYLEDAVFDNNAIIGIDGGENNAIVSIARNSYLARFLRKSQLLLKTIIANTNNTVEMASSAFDYEQGVTDEQLLNTVNIIQRIQSHLAEQDKKLFVFLIPSKSLSLADECCSDDDLYSRFYSAFDEAHVDTIDVQPFFEQSDNQRELFFLKDIHLTSSGHRVIASSIAAHLASE